MTDLKNILENIERSRLLGTSSRNSDAVALRWIDSLGIFLLLLFYK